jgi:hypothetical protein
MKSLLRFTVRVYRQPVKPLPNPGSSSRAILLMDPKIKALP